MATIPTTPAEWALYYLSLGLSVIPGYSVTADLKCTCGRAECTGNRPGKHPRLRSWDEYQVKPATEQQVRNWWRLHPDDNVIIITGAVSGVVVVDVDPAHGGADSIAEIEMKHGQLPATPTVETGSGGQHYWFKHPGTPVKTGQAFMPGLDSRGEGGYVVAPPSTHWSGTAYLWWAEYQVGEVPLAPMPPTILTMINGGVPRAIGAPLKPPVELEQYISGRATIGEGERNGELTRIAGHFFASGKDSFEVFSLLLNINDLACRPPLPRDEVQTIVRSIGAAESRKREAEQKVTELLTAERRADMPHDDRVEMIRAAFRQLGVTVDIVDLVEQMAMEDTAFMLELPDQTVDLGNSLLNYALVRSRILNATDCLIPRMKLDRWDPYARQLTMLALKQRDGLLRVQDEVADWLDDLQAAATEYPIERRRAGLGAAPIVYHGRIAVRPAYLLHWLESDQGLSNLSPHTLGAKLRQAGWKKSKIRVSKKLEDPQLRVWLSPQVRAWDAEEAEE